METTQMIAIVTMVVTWFLGGIAKKSTWFNTNLIPIQNIAIGIIVAIVEWLITKDFKTAIALSGILAGGTYDVIHNIQKIRKGG